MDFAMLDTDTQGRLQELATSVAAAIAAYCERLTTRGSSIYVSHGSNLSLEPLYRFMDDDEQLVQLLAEAMRGHTDGRFAWTLCDPALYSSGLPDSVFAIMHPVGQSAEGLSQVPTEFTIFRFSRVSPFVIEELAPATPAQIAKNRQEATPAQIAKNRQEAPRRELQARAGQERAELARHLLAVITAEIGRRGPSDELAVSMARQKVSNAQSTPFASVSDLLDAASYLGILRDALRSV